MKYQTPKEVEEKFNEKFTHEVDGYEDGREKTELINYPTGSQREDMAIEIKSFIHQQRIQDRESVEDMIKSLPTVTDEQNLHFGDCISVEQLLQALKK